jgi:RNA polymerase sigma factor (sigma-70 family)
MSSSHLSRIDTIWTMVHNANASQSAGHEAQSQLIERYGMAVKKYLMASMRNEDAAAEVFQEFALRLIRGDFRNACSDKGRFRSMIKTALYRLMIDYYRRNQKQKKLGSGTDFQDLAEDVDYAPGYDSFTLAWRESLLDESWGRLQQLQTTTGKPYFSVLRARVDQPTMTTNQLLDSLTQRGERFASETAFRVFLHRSRKRFAAILLQQVIESLHEPTDEEVELELIELGLHHYCKPAMRG